MKKSILVLLLFASTFVSAQRVTDSTSTPLKGTFIENGKLKLEPGYSVVLSKDKKVATVRSGSLGVSSGKVMCVCVEGGGGCSLIIAGNSLGCDGPGCCKLLISNDKNLASTTATTGAEDGKENWSKLILSPPAIKTLETTSVLPKGSSIKNGKIVLEKGYAFYESADKKILTVYRMSNGAIGGSYSCMCAKKDGPDKCGLVLKDGVGTCSGETCCGLVVTTGATNLALLGGESNNAVDWKIYAAPPISTKTNN